MDCRYAGDRHVSRRLVARRPAEALAIVTTEARIMAMRLLLTTTLLLAVALWWLR